jgi:AMMECR1 domain-containing protein
MPPNHRFMADLNAEGLIRSASKIGPQTTALIKATLKSRRYPEQAFRTCLGILNFGQKYDHQLIEQACQAVYEIKAFSYQAVKQELNLLHQQPETTIIEALPTHENIRGADYYQERNER